MKGISFLIAAAVAATVICLPASAHAARFGYFTVTFKGSQKLAWNLAGTKTDSCAIYAGTGSTDFKFGSTTARRVYVGSGRIGSFRTKAAGSQGGTFFVDTASGCIEPPGPSYSGPTTGCGPIAFKPELNFHAKGSSTWIHSLLNTADKDDRNYDCAHYLQLTSYDPEGGVLDVCGPKEDSNAGFENNGIRESGSEGIFPTKFKFSPRSLLRIKKGRKKTFKAKSSFNCSPPTDSGLTNSLTGRTQFSLTFKRTG